MKTIRSLIIISLVSFLLFGCNSNDVKDPPELVDMYYNDSHASSPSATIRPIKNSPIFLSEVTESTTSPTVTSTTIDITVDYEAIIDSEVDFEIVVETNGENYDLLYSVELNDSLLGDCVYTDQSTLYKASSTIITEGDGSYNTRVILTIPGSENHTTYLSERTISLTKILFTRDTADGTFPAEIPDNTTTTLLFEVHAISYFDTTLGVPVEKNNDVVDIILTPESTYFSQAETAAVSTLSIPNTVNGYPIGCVILEDLDWISTLEILGASEDVMILGDFSLLTSMMLDGLVFESIPALTDTRDVIINGIFPVLTSLTLQHTRGYQIYLTELSNSENDFYESYLEAVDTSPYSFPELETLTIDDCHANNLTVGADAVQAPFSKLTDFVLSDSIVGTLTFGNEDNDFPKLETITLTDTFLSEALISGTKPPEEAAAAFVADGIQTDWSLTLRGSLFSTLSFTDCSLGVLSVEGGTVESSRLSGFSFATTLFNRNNPHLYLVGSHPHLASLTFSNINIPSLQIGGIGSQFPILTEITFTNFEGGNLNIGERDCEFPLLTDITLTDVDCGNFIRIGGENADYDMLESIHLERVEANNLLIGYYGPVMDLLSLIWLEEVAITLTTSISLAAVALDEIVLDQIVTSALNVNPYGGAFDLYVNQLAAVTFTLSTDCATIYVSNSPATEWDYYEMFISDVDAIVTGSYVPA